MGTALVFMVIGVILAGAIIFGALFTLKRQVASSVGAEKSVLTGKIQELNEELDRLTVTSDNFASKAQLDSIIKQIAECEATIRADRESLKEIESKLDIAQKTVEQKEAHQQEIKSSKAEEEAQLAQLMASYQEIVSESAALEQNLAASLKDLDSILENLELSADNRRVLEELSNALSNAGSRLRDLITEYETTYRRLETLSQQHKDLEEEYTKLVEQQLGA